MRQSSGFLNLNLIVVLAFLIPVFKLKAQVGIGTKVPAASSILDITSTTKGLLPPRMTINSRNAIISPAAGLMIWCSNAGLKGELQVYNGSEWTNMIGGSRADLAQYDNYGGGTVVYIYQLGDPGYVQGAVHGLIVAPLDQSVGTNWGCHGTLLGGTNTVLNTGELNTNKIVISCQTAGIAAQICSDLVLNGYSDWYLPSKDELNKFYLVAASVFNVFSGVYWSSSEYSSPVAWSQDFSSGIQQVIGKTMDASVRAFRSF